MEEEYTVNTDEYILMSRKDYDKIREKLGELTKNYSVGSESYVLTREAIHTLDSGMHKCNVKPYDM